MSIISNIIGLSLVIFAINIIILLPLGIYLSIKPSESIEKWYNILKRTAKYIFLWSLVSILLFFIISIILPDHIFKSFLNY